MVTLDMTKALAPSVLMTIKVVGIKKWRMRMWIAARLIKLAGVVMNIDIKIEKQPWYGADL